MTARAQKFIGPMTFQALTRRPVFTDLFDLTEEAHDRAHPARRPRGPRRSIAPATANSIARLARGHGRRRGQRDRARDARAGADRAVDERQHVEPPADAREPRQAGRRRGLSRRRARRRLPRVPVDRPGPARRADRHRRGRRARAVAAGSRRRRGSSSPRARPTRRSIRCGSSATAAPARWASRSPPRRSAAAPTVTLVLGPSARAAADRRDHDERRERGPAAVGARPTRPRTPTSS